jgi:hypothetical protein
MEHVHIYHVHTYEDTILTGSFTAKLETYLLKLVQTRVIISYEKQLIINVTMNMFYN